MRNQANRKAYAIAWRKRNPDKVRATQRRWYVRHREQNKEQVWVAKIKRDYGITRQEYDALLELQGHRCAICGRNDDKRLAVDHDHETKKVRGLLCNRCNISIGAFEDSLELMRKAVTYLEIHAPTTS